MPVCLLPSDLNHQLFKDVLLGPLGWVKSHEPLFPNIYHSFNFTPIHGFACLLVSA